jgi:hypothetical protein
LAVGASNSRSAAGPLFFFSAAFLSMLDAGSVPMDVCIESAPPGRVVAPEAGVVKAILVVVASAEDRETEVTQVSQHSK